MIAEVRSSINNPVSVVDVSGSIINQQNNADIKLMEERYQRSAQAVSSLCEEDRKTDEFLNAACKKRVGNEGSERRNFKIPEVTSQREPNSETLKVEQGLRHELSAYIDGKGFTSQSGDKTFDIQIPEFSLEAIITGSSKVTSQDIVDLFNVAMKVRRKEVLCWYCYYMVILAQENTPTKYAIKKFIDNKEVYLTKMVNSHANIIQFHGVTKIEDEERYSLVLDYAEEITNAILWLHDYKDIVHGDLHPNNILLHRDTIKFADSDVHFKKERVIIILIVAY
ncbi:kinase-like domain-containing protein [Rhizophagus irregularis DAOM 181602=DAOM 197198]|nr:kinase-like domain-containing protein [Rhizophagus irregularis DAOM 181602=DAOM 197198]